MFQWKNIVVAASMGVLMLAALPGEVQASGGCCAPPPIRTVLCVAPPCSCCSQNVAVCVPGCCTEAPCVSWRSGFLGRQIGTYTWPCCGHSVKVVVTRRGTVKVRG